MILWVISISSKEIKKGFVVSLYHCEVFSEQPASQCHSCYSSMKCAYSLQRYCACCLVHATYLPVQRGFFSKAHEETKEAGRISWGAHESFLKVSAIPLWPSCHRGQEYALLLLSCGICRIHLLCPMLPAPAPSITANDDVLKEMLRLPPRASIKAANHTASLHPSFWMVQSTDCCLSNGRHLATMEETYSQETWTGDPALAIQPFPSHIASPGLHPFPCLVEAHVWGSALQHA